MIREGSHANNAGGKAEIENHPSFQKRLRLHEAEDVMAYVKLVKSGKLALNFYEIDRYLQRFPYFSKYSESVR
jgi:hypothetical protein